jgi:hypothetical protein
VNLWAVKEENIKFYKKKLNYKNLIKIDFGDRFLLLELSTQWLTSMIF